MLNILGDIGDIFGDIFGGLFGGGSSGPPIWNVIDRKVGSGGHQGQIWSESQGLPGGMTLPRPSVASVLGIPSVAGCDFGPCVGAVGGNGLLVGMSGNNSPESPFTFYVEVWARYLTICGDFMCDGDLNHGGRIVGLAPAEVRGLSEDTTVELMFTGALMRPGLINDNPILRIGPGHNEEGVRIFRVVSGGRWGKGGPKLPWHWHIWDGPKWPF